ncbi:amino acid/amide ABC transporter membrane protein 1, HAAT family [Tistlia consotensis]|uniref:Amino acid/amide ABC transporter membrane protein 1, HAAT family n=1 Tax=Tistlia consotensis USBA 355 TaxID=560819 RepID=A0A1Y6B6N5_9PROT|nr:branched-chain amino acid ABC transporter permease [Tistlia consotensis]SME91014.1 amino acid/amide ABC transporter membrane protein 1, HAAT family [Tistlia consotensis USBA 355]SNR27056.1 amino acid/amide ABC transporter membrane protein 1, HAAT family [Tistlia consotensis]
MLTVQIVNGLMEGMMLFLIASGLTLIFGVSRIINFAHGSLYMLGAFLTYQLVPLFSDGSLLGFAVAVLLGAVLAAAVGALFEMAVLRRIYRAPELMQLIVTIALVLIVRDLVRLVWGPNNVSVSMPDALAGAVQIGDSFFPTFQFAIFGAGLLVVALMIAIIRFTRAGVLLRAATDDRGMVALLGIDQRRIFTATFAAGSFLAGLAGGLASPFGNVNYLLDTEVIVAAFIVVVIGGLGNLYGALAGALAVGVIKSLGVLYFPRLAMVLIFLVMAAVLLVRSMGRRELQR